MNPWTALIPRIAAATGPDREIDAAIARLMGESAQYEGDGVYLCRYYTSSLDAVIALLDGIGTVQAVYREHKPFMDGRQWIATVRAGGHHRGQASTLVLALLLAIAKAKASTETPHTADGEEGR